MKNFALAILVLLGAALALHGLNPANLTPRTAAGGFGTERSIHDYLMAHPDVIIAAVKGMGQHEAKAEQQDTVEVLTEKDRELRFLPADPVAGDPQGDVTVVEFFDYRCPYCRQAHAEVQAMLKADPKIRLVYKEFPILSQGSALAAKAALAAQAQGKYQALHDALLTTQGDFSEDFIMQVAKSVGLDTARLEADMRNPAFTTQLQNTHQLARDLGITGTPTFIIGDQVTPGMVSGEDLLAMVQAARQGCKSCGPTAAAGR